MSRFVKILFVAMSLLGAVFLLLEFSQHGGGFAELLAAPAGLLMLIVAFNVLVATFTAMRFRVSAMVFGVCLAFREWAGLSFITTLYGYLFPARTGNIVRGIYLKKRHNMDYTEFVVLLGGSNAIELLVAALTGFASVLVLAGQGGLFRELAVWFGGVLSLGAAVGGLAYVVLTRFPRRQARIWQLLNLVIRGVRIFMSAPREMLEVALLSLLGLLVQACALYCCFAAFGNEPGLLNVLLAVCLAKLSAVISLTPGNIGVTEAAIIGVMVLGGVSVMESTQAALLSRILSMAVQGVLGVGFAFLLLHRLVPADAGE